MVTCKYTIIDANGVEQTFDSLAKLNSHLLTLAKDSDKSAVMYYTQHSKQRTLDIIKNVQQEFKGVAVTIQSSGASEEPYIKYNLTDSASVSKILESRKLPEDYELQVAKSVEELIDKAQYLVTPFNVDDWRVVEDAVLRKNFPHWDAELRKKFLDRVVETWDKLIQYGNEVHSVLEAHIKKKKRPALKHVPTNVADTVCKEFDSFMAHMENTYKSKFEVYSELPVKTDKINPIYKQLKNPINSINGRIDLVLVDEEGFAHVVDFKISRRKVGAWGTMENLILQDNSQDGGHDSQYAEQYYPDTQEVDTPKGKAFVLTEDNINDRTYSSPKKLKIGYQLDIYKKILESMGVPVRSTRILPFKMDLSYESNNTLPNTDAIDESKPTGIKNVYLEVDYTKMGTSEKHDTINPLSADAAAIRRIFQPKALFDKVDLQNNISEQMAKFFPNYTMAMKVQGRDLTLEDLMDRVKHVTSAEKEHSKGKRFKFWNTYKNHYHYTETMEEMEDFLKGYLASSKQKLDTEMSELSQRLSTILNSNTAVEGEEILPGDKNKQAFLNKHFNKYTKPNSGWNYIHNSELANAGIFVFIKDGIADVVNICNRELMETVKLSEGHSILGATHRDDMIDDKKIMRATIGNIELMRTMLIIDKCADLSSYKINAVKVLNMWNGTGTEELSEVIVDNYNQLCLAHNERTKLTTDKFTSTYQWAISEVEDILDQSALHGIEKDGNWRTGYDINTALGKFTFITNAMNKLRNKYTLEEYSDPKTPAGLAYHALTKAHEALTGNKTFMEKDQGQYLNRQGGQLYTGTMINSAGNSPSLNIQTIAAIVNKADQRIKHLSAPQLITLGKKVDAYLESKGRSQVLGNEATMYQNLLRTIDGKVDPNFRFKKLSDPSLSESEKQVLQAFLDQILKYKYNGSQERFDNDGDDAYNVPIKLASTGSRMQNSGVKGMSTHLKTKWENMLNSQEDLAASQSNDIALQQVFQGRIYNRYNLDTNSRRTMLSELTLDDFEMDLGTVMMDYVNTYVINQVYNDIMPELHGVIMSLRYQQAYLGMDYSEIEDVAIKYIKANVLNQRIMDKNLQAIYRPIAALKKVFTATALGLNYVSGLRELLQGTWINISRTMAQAYGKDQFTMADLGWAWSMIVKEAPLDINKVTLLDAMNAEYGMANMDPEMLAKKLGSSNKGIWNFNSGKLFFLNQIPDFYHRMGILLAKMKHDGVWECHYLDENGLLQYDYTKDARFALLRDPQADKNSQEYKEQYAIYQAMKLQFIAEGFNFENQPEFYLPRAYTYKEATSVKSFAEMCFGHYDKNTQMLAKHTFVGALFLHFRTFISAKMEQWVLKPGTYDQGAFKIKTDQNGDRFVMVTIEDENGTYSYLERFSNLKEGDNWQYVADWEGRFLEGIAYTMWDLGKALVTLDANSLKRIWNTPTKRANLKLFLQDMVIIALLGAIFNSIFMSEEEVENRSAFGNTIMSAVYTSTKDGVIFNTLGPLATDWTPPLISQIKRTYYNATDLLGGDSSVGEFIRSGIGIARTYNSFVHEA